MRVYVSGSVHDDVERIAQVRRLIAEAGHEPGRDWTTYRRGETDATESAAQLEAVAGSDALVLVLHPGLKAGWMEFGAALGLGIPCVVVRHPEVRDSMWFTLPLVRVVDAPGELVGALAEVEEQAGWARDAVLGLWRRSDPPTRADLLGEG